MNLELQITKDGSHTLYNHDLNETYHSSYGAINESRHVFISAGLKEKLKEKSQSINLLEVGFGTGLNALLTFLESNNSNTIITYTALEPYPLSDSIIKQLNYISLPELIPCAKIFTEFHDAEFDKIIHLNNLFYFIKFKSRLEDVILKSTFDLVYFDAFAPGVQPEIWSKQNFQKISDSMNENGILVTYCSKGEVRRNLINVGFEVEKLPGPEGKREILRAIKPSNSLNL